MKKVVYGIIGLFLFLTSGALCVNLSAGIVYDSEINTIKVTDFPSDMPCSLIRLSQMDKMFGWMPSSLKKEQNQQSLKIE